MADRAVSVLLLLTAFGCAQPSAADKPREPETVHGNGVVDGNGGGSLTYKSNPWFLGPEVVKYCVESSSDFSLPLDRASVVVAAVIKDWVTTLPRLNGDDRELPIIGGAPKDFSTNFEPVPDCSQTHQLQFKLGTSDPAIDANLASSQENLVGFAHLNDYDQDSGRGSGFVFITPDRGPKRYPGEAAAADFWQDEDRLFDVLLHEMGHVFGFQHDGATFMIQTYPGYRVANATKARLSSSILVARDAVASEGSGGELCGDFDYENDESLAVLFGQKVERICVATKSGDFSERSLSFYASSAPSSPPLKSSATLAGSDSTLIGVEAQLGGKWYTLASYVDTFRTRGTLTVGDQTVPFILTLTSNGFEFLTFDVHSAKWSETSYRVSSLDLLQAQGS